MSTLLGRYLLPYLPLMGWRAEAVNLPSRDLLLHSRRNCPPYNKAHFFIDQRWIAPPRSSAYYIAVCAFYKMHINSCGEFHSATSCPESKRSLAEPMRAVWLSASLFLFSFTPNTCVSVCHTVSTAKAQCSSTI